MILRIEIQTLPVLDESARDCVTFGGLPDWMKGTVWAGRMALPAKREAGMLQEVCDA